MLMRKLQSNNLMIIAIITLSLLVSLFELFLIFLGFFSTLFVPTMIYIIGTLIAKKRIYIEQMKGFR